MSDDAAAAVKEHPMTRMKRELAEKDAAIDSYKSENARLRGMLSAEPVPAAALPVSVSAKAPAPVDISTFYKDLIVALVTHDPGSMTREVLPGKKKNAVLAYLAYCDIVERHDELAAILSAENASADEKEKKAEAAIEAERQKSLARKQTNATRKGPIDVVRNVRTPEEAFLASVQTQSVAGPMSADD